MPLATWCVRREPDSLACQSSPLALQCIICFSGCTQAASNAVASPTFPESGVGTLDVLQKTAYSVSPTCYIWFQDILPCNCLREATAELVRRKNGTSHGSGRVHWGHVKAFHDGSLGSRTAFMHQPYSDQPGNAGMRVTPLEQLRAMAAGADAAGLHVRIKPPTL